MSKSLAIIPARQGSKRLPGKNIKIFKGKPLIHYTIACVLKSGLFDEIVVTTDSDEIKEIAEKKLKTILNEKNKGHLPLPNRLFIPTRHWKLNRLERV